MSDQKLNIDELLGELDAKAAGVAENLMNLKAWAHWKRQEIERMPAEQADLRAETLAFVAGVESLFSPAEAVPKVVGAIRVLRKAFVDACELADRAEARTRCADSFLEAVIATIERDMTRMGAVLVQHPKSPLAKAKRYLERRKGKPSPIVLVKGP